MLLVSRALSWTISIALLFRLTLAFTNDTRLGTDTIRQLGRCSMYDTCGRKGGIFGQTLPCVDNGKARPIDDALQQTLRSVCGDTVTWDQLCCTQDQLETLQQNLAQAEPLLALCPACRLNFRDFYCSLTCSPDQSTFLSVTSSQQLSKDDGPAVKSLAYHVDPAFGQAFFDSCKNVKFGATNGYAMDLIGGGAKTWTAFVGYMGQERPGLGSPFQIDYPQPPKQVPVAGDEPVVDNTIQPFKATAFNCASDDPDIRCACADCPSTCTELPARRSPAEERASACRVGRLSCFSFLLILLYSLGVASFVFGIGLQTAWQHSGKINLSGKIARRLRPKTSDASSIGDRVQLEDNDSAAQQGVSKPKSWHSSNSASSESARWMQGRAQPSDSSAFTTDSPAASLSRRKLGRGAPLLEGEDALASYQPRAYVINTILGKAFYRLGFFCASRPLLTIALGLAICGGLNAGWARFAVERDPVKLWVAKGSPTEINKSKFESYFGPFYRTEQIFLSLSSGQDEAVLDWQRLQYVAQIESEIRALESPQHQYRLEHVCFAPAAETDPINPNECIVQSFMGYFSNSLAGVTEESWAAQLDDCASSPSLCLSPSGQPLNPRLLFGGIPGYSGRQPPVNSSQDLRVGASQARAIVITYVVSNSLDPAVMQRAEEWEKMLHQYLEKLTKRAPLEAGLGIAYSTGVSLEQELNKATNTDIPIVILSYLLMFVYVSLNLGGTIPAVWELAKAIVRRSLYNLSGSLSGKRGPIALQDDTHQPSLKYLLHRILIESKFLLGFWGIIIVLLSVSTSVGLFSFFGVKITLIIAEVIPFLVLAIGVDNVFLLSHEIQRQNSSSYSAMTRHGNAGVLTDTDDRRVGYDVDLGGLLSPEERVAKALARMGPSILLSATCEAFAFALGAIVGMPAVRNFAIYAAGAVAINALLQVTVFVSAITLDLHRSEASRVDCLPCIKLPSISIVVSSTEPNLLQRLISDFYAPLLLKKRVKQAVLVIFSLIFVLSWVGAREVQLGLDQRLALPTDSYLVRYFDAIDTFLDVGPPVYFVEENLNVSSRAGQQASCSRFSTCQYRSIPNTLEAERKRRDVSFLAEPPAVWLDDFFQWLNPALDSCCRVKQRNQTHFCSPEDSEFDCIPCFEVPGATWNVNLEGLPEDGSFDRYLEQWLISPANEACPLGGRAGYASAIHFSSNKSVDASHFRTYHAPLKSQSDYIESLAAADRIAADLTKQAGTNVFPYSLHYVFFDQYAYISATTRQVLLLAWLAVFAITTLTLGSWRTGFVVTVSVALTSINVMGMMGVWNISLNAISLVNLVISVGIAVEFCSHIARAYLFALGGGLPQTHVAGPADRDERVWAALSDVGPSIFSGITMTKLIGIAVLALTRSKLLRTYYFKMWLTLIISGAMHGLIFLPVALSYEGGQGFASENDDQLWMSDQLTASYSGRPFLVQDDDDSASDN